LLPRASVLAERGSMLPLFLGLVAISGCLALGLAEVCSSYIFRESIQELADQTALISASKGLKTTVEASPELAKLSKRIQLAEYQLVEGKTVELKLCGAWQGWLKLPGLNLQKQVCASAAAR